MLQQIVQLTALDCLGVLARGATRHQRGGPLHLDEVSRPQLELARDPNVDEDTDAGAVGPFPSGLPSLGMTSLSAMV
ncbi:hypothetical protein [Streptomyces microflavus]|uniref:hypothetical protein n=1 Tax=Streptomyces microflavus TaxID=1919 RepID=UPI0038664E8A|nr:hypothetical protein OG721_00160 [Streptomyces microflavus]WST19560.1 hypothetical protein OG721_38940 [Streptomyces microflavus]